MSEDADKESKTEEASPRRIEEALKKGNTPFSREIGVAALLIAIGMGLPEAARHLSGQASSGLRMFVDRPGEFELETAHDALALIWFAVEITASATWPLLCALAVVGVAGAALQNPPRLVLHRIKPEFSRISPSKGFSRIVGRHGQVEFAKSLAKMIIVCVIVYWSLKGSPDRISATLHMSHAEWPNVLVEEVAWAFTATGLCAVAVAALDLLWTRMKWSADLRMSQQELKDEHKQAEGDPVVRARQRSVARDRARRRMMSEVPKATLVLANPTHYAVALRYVHGESAVPTVVAKGVDHLALRIREIAEEHRIPVVEDRALARSLYEAVKTDQPIPPEFFRAVAELILYLMSRDGRQPPQAK
jgi:flagellar biosynthesis protein FlhB